MPVPANPVQRILEVLNLKCCFDYEDGLTIDIDIWNSTKRRAVQAGRNDKR